MKIVFRLYSRLTRKIGLIPSPLYLQYFPGLALFSSADYLTGKFCRKIMFEMADTNLRKTCSILLSATRSEFGIYISCFEGSSTYIRDSEATKKPLYYVLITNIKTKEKYSILRKYVNNRILTIAYRIICTCVVEKCFSLCRRDLG